MGRAAPANLTAWSGRELWGPVFETTVVGTTGAGDAAIAGLLAALLRGLGPIEAITVANAVGACNVEAPDAVSGIRAWAETLARIEAGWPRRTLLIDTPGWRFDETHQVWLGPRDRAG
jgi:sugar/nucleoside kinase (ribokinase family)